jgi:hypothetical protein
MTVLGKKEWQEHAALVGAVTLAWNRNVHQLLRVFTHLTGIESPIADAIFFSPQSDSSQRRLIKRVADAVNLADADQNALNNILKRLDKVSTGRNLAAHIIFGISAFDPATGTWGPKVVPALTPLQDSRLQDDFAKQFMDIEQEMARIYEALENWLVCTPFPKRPWAGPPLPLAAAAQFESLMAESPYLENLGSQAGVEISMDSGAEEETGEA